MDQHYGRSRQPAHSGSRDVRKTPDTRRSDRDSADSKKASSPSSKQSNNGRTSVRKRTDSEQQESSPGRNPSGKGAGRRDTSSQSDRSRASDSSDSRSGGARKYREPPSISSNDDELSSSRSRRSDVSSTTKTYNDARRDRNIPSSYSNRDEIQPSSRRGSRPSSQELADMDIKYKQAQARVSDRSQLAVHRSRSSHRLPRTPEEALGDYRHDVDRDRRRRAGSAPRESRRGRDSDVVSERGYSHHGDDARRLASMSLSRATSRQGSRRSSQIDQDIALEDLSQRRMSELFSGNSGGVPRSPSVAGSIHDTNYHTPSRSSRRTSSRSRTGDLDSFDRADQLMARARISSYHSDNFNRVTTLKEELEKSMPLANGRHPSLSSVHAPPSRQTSQTLPHPSKYHNQTKLSSSSNVPSRSISHSSSRSQSGDVSYSPAYSSPSHHQQHDRTFSSLSHAPSQTSLTSSDARSDVCLDLPDLRDYRDEDDLHLHEINNVKVSLDFPNAPYDKLVHHSDVGTCGSLFVNIFLAITSFILFWPLLAVVVAVVPIFAVLKRVLSWCCCCGRRLWGRCCICLCHAHLSSSEVMWLGNSQGGAVAQSLIVLQKGLDIDRIRNLIDSRLLSVENRHGEKMYPRFTQKVVEFCCGYAWVTDRKFSVSRHVFGMPGYIETLDDLQHYISKMAAETLSEDHPLWEVQVLHNFREPRDTVLLFRMHLCLSDGVSMVNVLEHALVDSQKQSSLKQKFSALASSKSPCRVMFSGPLTFLSRYLFRSRDHNLLHVAGGRKQGEKVVAWSEPFSLSGAMRVKQVARCTLAELLLSVTAGNIRTYLQVSGIDNPHDVSCVVPVDFQSPSGGQVEMANKYALAVVRLPANTEGAIPRLWETKSTMERFKNSAESAIVSGARWVTGWLLPPGCFQGMWRKIYSRATVLVANLAGPTNVLKFDSREIKCMMFWAPPLDHVAVSVSFLTYADQLRMAVICDRTVLPNPDLLTRDFIYKLETLSKLLAHRRIPGESAPSRHENLHLLSSFTLDDLTAEQIKLEMTLVQQEIHDLKVQLKAGDRKHISNDDTHTIQRIETLKERSRELLMYLRKRKSEETQGGIILTDDLEDDLDSEYGYRHRDPPRRRTLSVSSRMSTASVSSQCRPLSTATVANLPSPQHAGGLSVWPEGDLIEEMDELGAPDIPSTRLPGRVANGNGRYFNESYSK